MSSIQGITTQIDGFLKNHHSDNLDAVFVTDKDQNFKKKGVKLDRPLEIIRNKNGLYCRFKDGNDKPLRWDDFIELQAREAKSKDKIEDVAQAILNVLIFRVHNQSDIYITAKAEIKTYASKIPEDHRIVIKLNKGNNPKNKDIQTYHIYFKDGELYCTGVTDPTKPLKWSRFVKDYIATDVAFMNDPNASIKGRPRDEVMISYIASALKAKALEFAENPKSEEE